MIKTSGEQAEFLAVGPRAPPESPRLSPSGKKLGFTLDNGKLHNVSLGQGQEVVAEDTLDVAAEKGHWVILQVRAASGRGHPPPGGLRDSGSWGSRSQAAGGAHTEFSSARPAGGVRCRDSGGSVGPQWRGRQKAGTPKEILLRTQNTSDKVPSSAEEAARHVLGEPQLTPPESQQAAPSLRPGSCSLPAPPHSAVPLPPGGPAPTDPREADSTLGAWPGHFPCCSSSAEDVLSIDF